MGVSTWRSLRKRCYQLLAPSLINSRMIVRAEAACRKVGTWQEALMASIMWKHCTIIVRFQERASNYMSINELLVRKGGFEPPRLSAPPPQDGVSASSTTSALCELPVINSLTSRPARAFTIAPDLHRLVARDGLLWLLQVRQSRKQLVDRNLPRVYMARGGLNVIVSGDILQREGIRVLSGPAQKRPKRLCRMWAREDIVTWGVFQKP